MRLDELVGEKGKKVNEVGKEKKENESERRRIFVSH